MFPDREDASVDIYADVVQALTLASDLLDKALMKLSVSMFDISLPSQHLLFVFDAPKWLLVRPASVPASGTRKCVLWRCIEPVLLLWYQEFRVLQCACFNFRPLPA